MQFEALTIVGVGLIGGSIGKAARRRGIARKVIGVGRDAASLGRAREVEAIDSFTLDLMEGVRGADVVVFCTPVDKIARQVKEAASAFKKGALVTDAGSTKANIIQELEGHLPDGVDFVGSHPLAGSEKRGPEYASAGLFEGRVAIVTPTPHTRPDAVERTAAFWRALGSEVKFLDPQTHDRALAMTSHLPHLLASALAGSVPDAWRPFAATGFRDTTRIASSDPALWTAIFRQNATAVAEAMQHYREVLEAFRRAILEDDEPALMELLSQGKRVRDALGS